jgi:hypothetical protein
MENGEAIVSEIANSQLPIPNSQFPLVACLTCTFGRFQRMRGCLAFFLLQDYPAKHLFILNNHPTPLRCELPGVTVFNDPSQEPGIPRQRLLELAIRNSQFAIEFVHTWDDDDAWLPWHLSQAVRQVSASPRPRVSASAYAAWKPARSWIRYERTGEYKLNSNNYEASMIVRRGYMQRFGYGVASGDEHRPLLNALKSEGALGTTEVGARASYIYTWRGDFTHASAALARDMKSGVHEQTLAERDAAWRRLQTDPGDGRTPLTPADVSPRYKDVLAHCRSGLSEYEALELSVMLGRYCR